MGRIAAVKARVRVSRSASPETIEALSEMIRVAVRQLGVRPTDPIEITMCRSFDDHEIRELAGKQMMEVGNV